MCTTKQFTTTCTDVTDQHSDDEIMNTPNEDECVEPPDVAGDNISDLTSIVSSKKNLF